MISEITALGPRDTIKMQLENLIEWRNRVSEKHPYDTRNDKAVLAAQKLLESLKGLPEQPNEKKLAELADQYNEIYLVLDPDDQEIPAPVDEELSSDFRSIGFHCFPASIDDLCDTLCSTISTHIELAQDLKKGDVLTSSQS